MNFLHLVKYLQRVAFQILHMRLTAFISFGNGTRRRQNILIEIMAVLDVVVLHTVMISQTVTQAEARKPDGVHSKILHQHLAEHHRSRSLCSCILRKRKLRCDFLRTHDCDAFIKLLKIVPGNGGKLFISLLRRSNDFKQISAYHDQIPDLTVLLKQLVEARQLMIDNFPQHFFKMEAVLFERRQLLPRRNAADPDILGRDQLILVKQRYLHAAPADIYDRRRVLNDRFKLRRYRRDRLIINESLLGIAEHLNRKAGLFLNVIHKYQHIAGFPECARRTGPVRIHLVAVHDAHKIAEHPTELLYIPAADPTHRVCIQAETKPRTNPVYLLHHSSGGKFKNFHFGHCGSDTDRSKCFECHGLPPVPGCI